MESYSKTDEVLALLNKRERGEASFSAGTTNQEESLRFRDFLPSPAAAVLHKLQRVSAQPQSAQPVPLTRSASEALKVVLGEQRPEESRKLRYTDALCMDINFDLSFRCLFVQRENSTNPGLWSAACEI